MPINYDVEEIEPLNFGKDQDHKKKEIATTDLPKITGLSAKALAPEKEAGVKLAWFVLQIAAGSIFLFLLYLIAMELFIGDDVNKNYAVAINQNGGTNGSAYLNDKLETFSSVLISKRNNPDFQITPDVKQKADSAIAMTDELSSITSTQKAQLKDCLSLPHGEASKSEKLDHCLGIIETIRHTVSGVTNLQIAGEAVTKLIEHRQNLHMFWIQAAQLVLLNLLLPLLTALFGYVFGTQQAQKSD